MSPVRNRHAIALALLLGATAQTSAQQSGSNIQKLQESPVANAASDFAASRSRPEPCRAERAAGSIIDGGGEPRLRAVVRGVAGNATCATSVPYSGTLAVIELVQPMTFGSISSAHRIELIMPERYHVQFGHYVGKTVQATCELTESTLCGYPQIACAVVEMRVEP